MKAVDTNILVYAHREDSEWHTAAAACLQNLAEGKSSWAIPWPCLHEFLSIVTHPRIFAPASPLAAALDQLDAWMESPSIVLLTETAGHWAQLRSLLVTSKVVGPKVHDARIAALCLQHAVSVFADSRPRLWQIQCTEDGKSLGVRGWLHPCISAFRRQNCKGVHPHP